jgi:hypothetical protein
MTLLIALANREFICHVADRRLTAAGGVVEEEEGKVGFVLCNDARFLYGFTGLARAGTFQTRRWILDALYQAAPPDFSLYATLQRFRERATKDFSETPELTALPKADRRLTLLFTGHLYTRDPPVVGIAVISNCLDPPTDELSPEAWDHFKSYYTSEKKPGSDELAYVQRIGAHRAMTPEDYQALKAMLRERRPAQAVIARATDMMVRMADRPGAGGTIGKQVTWLKITPDPEIPSESGYYSNVPTSVVYTAGGVVVQSHRQAAFDQGAAWIEGGADGGAPPPLAVPKVGRNYPCPCGSGKKYKRCHGH